MFQKLLDEWADEQLRNGGSFVMKVQTCEALYSFATWLDTRSLGDVAKASAERALQAANEAAQMLGVGKPPNK